MKNYLSLANQEKKILWKIKNHDFLEKDAPILAKQSDKFWKLSIPRKTHQKRSFWKTNMILEKMLLSLQKQMADLEKLSIPRKTRKKILWKIKKHDFWQTMFLSLQNKVADFENSLSLAKHEKLSFWGKIFFRKKCSYPCKKGDTFRKTLSLAKQEIKRHNQITYCSSIFCCKFKKLKTKKRKIFLKNYQFWKSCDWGCPSQIWWFFMIFCLIFQEVREAEWGQKFQFQIYKRYAKVQIGRGVSSSAFEMLNVYVAWQAISSLSKHKIVFLSLFYFILEALFDTK